MVGNEPDAYYAVLGCHPKSSADELKRAYRRCVIESHPDKGGTPEKFQAVRTAAEVLCDEGKRVEYDVRSKLAARMSQLKKDYERFKSTAGPPEANRRRASADARVRAQWERDRERREKMTSEWRERAKSARDDQEQRWKKARERTAAFEEKWETTFKEFKAMREETQQQRWTTAAAASGNAANAHAHNAATGRKTQTRVYVWQRRRPVSAINRRTSTSWPSTSAETETDNRDQQQQRRSQKWEEEDEKTREGRATVFTAQGRFECYHVDKLCKALLTACGAPVEHDFHFAARVERREPCRFCCKDNEANANNGGGYPGERVDVRGRGRPSTSTARPATVNADSGAAGTARTTRQRPKSALHEKLPRRNYSSNGGYTGLRPTRPASARTFGTASGESDDSTNARSSRFGSSSFSSSSSNPAPRYAAPRGKLHHSSVDCPCLVGRSGVKQLAPADICGLRACGTCN